MYISTRGNYEKVSAAQAIKLGMVPMGGLFVPDEIPQLSLEDIANFKDLTYQQLAEKILALYLKDFTLEEIKSCINQAYNLTNFDHPSIAPLYNLKENTYIMELWHGPTAAFKDMALQLMPYLLSLSIKKVNTDKEIVILVATSGDTGKAALEGFKNVPGIKIIVFYPYQGVSKVQELQMTTTDGNNTNVIAVKGNFDDCQSTVKEIFSNEEFKNYFNQKGYEFSSANSINWGRLVPQIIYYFNAYNQLLKTNSIKVGEKINFVVPTGNFGNILAGWYAYKMGLPVNKLICASNENNVLTDFFRSGVYDRNRDFKQTNSPSMDILISSNLERYLFEITGHDSEKIIKYMSDLNKYGNFKIDDSIKDKIAQELYAGFASQTETLEVIKNTFENFGYTIDTHTAVAVKVYNDYVKETGDRTKTVIDSTASPFKFSTSVLEALKGKNALTDKDEFKIIEELSKMSKLPVHHGLKDLEQRPVLHKKVCQKEEIKEEIKKLLI